MRTVIFSPHCDDAPFSLGAALLARQLGSRPRVLIVFSRSGFARGAHRGESVEAVTAVRRVEEEHAARLASYAPTFWDLPEALVRSGFGSFNQIFNPACEPRSDAVWRDVLDRMRHELADRPDVIGIPLGCGHHVDHRIVRDAALAYCGEAGLLARAFFYEDLPYAAGLSRARLDEHVEHVRAVPVGIEPVVLGMQFIRAKQALLACYASQVTARSVAAVAVHAEHVGGERLWAHPTCLSLLRSHLSANSVVS